MLEATTQRSRLPLLLLLGAGVVAIVVGGGLQRAEILLRGGNPLASPVASEHVDQPYPESPLAVALRLEADGDAEAALQFADTLAEELGWWLLTTTGARDVHAAEKALWSGPGPDAFAVRWAVALQEREVYARKSRRLSDGVPEEGFVYVHPDDLVLLFAHVAWRLDLRTELVRSPVHHYVLWREPGGGGVRGIEPTCFRRVDATGAVVDSEEPSVGRRLVIPEDRYPSGAGGIRNPDPLPPGAYQTVTADSLESDLAARHGRWRRALRDGLAAWEAGDDEALARAAERATALWRDSQAPEHLVLQAAATGDLSRLQPVFDHHEPDGPVVLARSDLHAMAMWLDLRAGPVGPVDWNARVIPLMNRHKDDPERFRELCDFGRLALEGTEQTLEELMPACVSPRSPGAR